MYSKTLSSEILPVDFTYLEINYEQKFTTKKQKQWNLSI